MKTDFNIQVYTIKRNVSNQYIGTHAYCSWTGLSGSPMGGTQNIYSRQKNEWYVSNLPYDGWASGVSVSVTCLNLPGAGM